jgi:septum site-determining protein MinD
MTRTIAVISGKGGVGKTTIVSNLAVELTNLGRNVIAIDANPTTPNLGLHLGMHLAPKTLHNVLRGEIAANDATYYHPLGFKIIPSSMAIDDLQNADVARLPEVTMSLVGRYDYVLLDSAAGLGREAVAAITAADDILLVTNPNWPSVVDALKTIQIAKAMKKDILGVVVNRVGMKPQELLYYEIENILGEKIIAEIPEDENVEKSIAYKLPLVSYDAHSPAAVEMRRLAHKIFGIPFDYKKPKKPLLGRFKDWLTG